MTLTQTRTKTDRETQLDVLAEVARDFRFKPAEIGVEVDNGIVTLTGTVSSYLKVGVAADLATNVPGVKDVANKLTVAPIGPFRDDTAIAGAVRHSLEWDVVVPEDRIDSVVRDGVVTLKGTVDYWHQRKSAADAIANLHGVVLVNNHITIAPTVRNDLEIHQDLTRTLLRRFPLDQIDVAVNRGEVGLMGRVHTYRVRLQAEAAARATYGVKNVTNRLIVSF